MKRKIKKLIKNPKLFFIDMAEKRIGQNHKLPLLNKRKKSLNNNKYTVISAVYGVERYIDDFLISIISQSLDFENNIEVILVDDGSLDNSKEKILKWCYLYPNNIKYVYKINGGQASARNEGLKYYHGNWVTFIDPDDTVDIDYFKNIDDFISLNKRKSLALISCNCIFNIEGQGLKNRHPLRSRFSAGNRTLKIKSMRHDFQLSASLSFMRSDLLQSSNLKFPENIKPNFEDGYFVTKYLLEHSNYEIGFCTTARYLYRKRSDESSTLDQSIRDPRRYTDVIRNGYLEILNDISKKTGTIPVWLQNEILYELFWLIKYALNNNSRMNFLSDVQKSEFKKLVNEAFKFIDSKTIMDFPYGGCWFFHKKGMLNLFKRDNVKQNICYLTAKGIDTKNYNLTYFTYLEDCSQAIFCNDVEIAPYSEKTIRHYFLDETFIFEKNITLNEINPDSAIEFYINGLRARISFEGKQNYPNLSVPLKKKSISNRNKIKTIYFKSKESIYKDAWVFMERDVQADDNAEHFYRYVMKNHPEKKIFFVLRKTSNDWTRLKSEGFNLINFASIEHEAALSWSSQLISSHADHYVLSQLTPAIRLNKSNMNFTFLQHGIIKDDLSGWLNKKDIDLFITSTKDEYNSIVMKNSPYKFSEKEVVLTGLARHDSLIRMSDKVKKEIILIMPTWRNNIMGKVLGSGNSREKNTDFMKTEYAQRWKEFLHSDLLKKLNEQDGIKIIFFPHTNIAPYIKEFELPKHIIPLENNGLSSIQALFSSAKVLITDYSSVAFDAAYISTPIIYYQFDKDTIFNGDSHIYKKGYFDYHKQGFGPVCDNIGEVMDSLRALKENKFKNPEEYTSRINKTFTIRDGKNCERIFNALININNKNKKTHSPSFNEAYEKASECYTKKHYDLAYKAFANINRYSKGNINTLSLVGLFNCSLALGKYSVLDGDISTNSKNHFILNVLRLAFYENWKDMYETLLNSNLSDVPSEIQFIALRCGYIKGENSPLYRKSIKVISKKHGFDVNHLINLNHVDGIVKYKLNYHILLIIIENLLNKNDFTSAEMLIDQYDIYLDRWQFHRLYARLRRAEGKLSKAKWHYNKCIIDEKVFLPHEDSSWLNINTQIV